MKSTDACRLVSQPGDSGMLEYSVKIERSEAAVLCGGVDTVDIEMRRYHRLDADPAPTCSAVSYDTATDASNNNRAYLHSIYTLSTKHLHTIYTPSL